MIELNKIYQGDCLEILKTLSDESVDMVMTSPPYFGLRSYLPKDHPDKKKEIGSEGSMQEHLKVLSEIFVEVKRVLKPTGSFWLNYGDAYSSSNWLGDKPNKYEAQTISTGHNFHGRAATPDYQDKCLLMLPERIALRMIDSGWILRQKIVWAKQVYDHKERRTKGSAMPTSVKDRFNTTFEYLYHFTKNKKYFFDLDAVRIPAQTGETWQEAIDRKSQGSSKFLIEHGQSKQQTQRKINRLQVSEYRNKDGTIHWGAKGEPHPSKNPRWNPNYKQVPQDYGKRKLKGQDARGLNRWMLGTPNYVYKRDYATERSIRTKRGIS